MAEVTAQSIFELALQHQQAGRLPKAEELYRKILAQQPKHALAMRNLGILALQCGRNDVAEELFRKAIALRPDCEAQNLLGNALKANGKTEEAIACYRDAIARRPDSPETYSNLANALVETGQFDEAIAACQTAVTLRPDYARAYIHLGNALHDSGRLDGAISSYRHAISLDPKLADAHGCLALALKDKGQFDEAIAAFREAIALRPGDAAAQNNLGIALKQKGDLDEAITAYRAAIALRPKLAEAHNNLGNALRDAGQVDDAIAEFQAAIELSPKLHEALGNICYSFYFSSAHDAAAISEVHRRWNHEHAEPLRQLIEPHRNDRDPERRLKLGYVSPDFRDHPVGRFLLPLMERHNHEQFDVFCYSNVPRPDAITARLRSSSDHWQEIGSMKDEQAAARIRADGIDILVDLSGHTAGNRMPLFARKPAPLQVSYLGYPGTTGLSTLDYRLTDALADPPGWTDRFYSEKLLRLPQTNWCFAEPRDSPPVKMPPAINRGYVTFGSFNNFAKVTGRMLQTWGRILRDVPRSRLLLKSLALGSAGTRERVLQNFAAQGIDAGRVQLRGLEPDHASHLELYGQMDIALDTFPYHGTTTTCDALWMGVPVITLAGRSHVSRVGLSLLTNIGLPELVATTSDEYISLAVSFARNLDRLKRLRTSLRDRMRRSLLMDAQKLAGNIESAYRQIWRTWCQTSG